MEASNLDRSDEAHEFDTLSASALTQDPGDPQASKASRIKLACDHGDLVQLLDLATSENGLLSDDLRQAAWPLLLGCHELPVSQQISDWLSLPGHRDEEQVKLDVNRAFVYYPNGRSPYYMAVMRPGTSELRLMPPRRYFQGASGATERQSAESDHRGSPQTSVPLLLPRLP